MKTLFTTLFLIVNCSILSKAQNDTIWFDKDWNQSTKQNASFYRPPLEKEGDLYKMKDYYIDGSLQMNGTSRFKDSVHLEGKAVWYSQNGKVNQEETYKNNTLDGVAIYYRENSKDLSREITYDMGKTISDVRFDKNRDGIRYKRYYEDGRIVKTDYYGSEGKFIGTYYESEDEYQNGNGKRVTYYNDPMSVKIIEVFENGGQLYFDAFYKNGNKQVSFNDTKLQEIFYNPEGQQIGVIQYTREDGLLYYQEGETFDFYYNGIIKSKTTYADGYQTSHKEFSLTGVLVREEFYEENETIKIVSYTNEGKKIGVYEEKNGKRNGTIRTKDNRIITYEDNLVQKAIIPYRMTKKVFASLENSQITFYDSTGNVLGRLTVELEEGEFRLHQLENSAYLPRPIEGTLFEKNYNDEITDELVFEEGKKRSESRYIFYQGKTYKETLFYNENEEFHKSISYFSNGEVKSIIHYLEGTTGIKTAAIFFDKSGKKLSEYDYKTNTGTIYKYFPQSDFPKSIIEKENDKTLTQKRYERYYDTDLKENKVVLREDIDYNGEAKFYSREGELIAEATYKNGEPTGTLYSLGRHEFIEYKKGKKHGKSISYEEDEKTIQNEGNYKNGEKHGTFTYSSYGIKQKTVNYKNGQKEGYVISYDKKGNETARLLYKNNEPYEGTHIDFYGKGKVYKEGEIIKEFSKNADLTIETSYSSEDETSTIVYDKSNQKVLSYTERNGQLQDTLYHYKNNDIAYNAVFEKGYLIDGSVWVTHNNGFQAESYAHLHRDGDSITIKTYNEENEMSFEGTVNIGLYKNYSERIVKLKLGHSLYVRPSQLFLKAYETNVF
ncbi:hypothetical protein ABWH96_05265 [Marivirga tractuosa]|uniref:toxin-antitoxin system YwqK family antitoxin n=1 Tax=Marivirga tractuosa TaxID=1006 RepID=UPI0035D06659